jgi:chromatin remodeling complex protein RSC6
MTDQINTPIETETDIDTSEVGDTESVTTSSALDVLIKKWDNEVKIQKGFISELRSFKKEILSLEKENDKQKRSKKKKRENNENKKPSGFARPTRISKELAEFLGLEEDVMIARTQVTKKLTEYVNEHDLKDPENKRNILLTTDAGIKLGAILTPIVNPETQEPVDLSFFNLQRYIKHHFPKSVKTIKTEMVAPEADIISSIETPVTTVKRVKKKIVKKSTDGVTA